MPTDIWTDTDISFQCVGCTCVLCTWECCARVSPTEIRRNPFNYPPEQGPAFLSPLCLCYRIYLTPSSPVSTSFHLFSLHSHCSSLPLQRAPVPLDFLTTTFPFWFHVPIASYLPSSRILHIPPCLFLPLLFSPNKLAANQNPQIILS